jgi:hypothetical protein
MPVTGKPFMVLGIVTDSSEPVNPVIVISPLVAVKRNCAWTVADSVNSNRRGSSISVQAVFEDVVIALEHLVLASEVCLFMVVHLFIRANDSKP